MKAENNKENELATEYQFDYRKGKPNRFAQQLAGTQIMVVLDPDVAEVFKTPESVNNVLRAIIANMPLIHPVENSGAA